MRVLMVMQHVNFFRNLDTVVRELDARGHEIVMLHGSRLEDAGTRAKLARKMEFVGRGLQTAQEQIAGVAVGYRPEPEEPLQRRLRVGRQIVNRSIYLRKNHPAPERVTEGIERRLPSLVKFLLRTPVARLLLGRRLVLSLWRRLELRAAPSETVLDVLRQWQPDVLLVSPTVWPKGCVEADYIRAARELRVPTVGYLNSWDNLTSKGTVHVLPDAYLVWNEALAQEAVELHDIPRRLIETVGAPHVDRFFEMQPTQSHAEVCREMGAPEDKPYVLYLCSSGTLIRSEVHIVTALADALFRRFHDDAPTLVVRPHPVNAGMWRNFDYPDVVVHPRHGDQADTPETWQKYYNQLAGAVCCFGLNTTAFMEAVVADRPCLTIVSDELYHVQGWTGHFRHLLAGDFLEISPDVEGTAARIGAILAGADEKAESRRAFAESFLRPRGIGTPAATVVADVIEALGSPGGAPVAPRDTEPQLVPEAR